MQEFVHILVERLKGHSVVQDVTMSICILTIYDPISNRNTTALVINVNFVVDFSRS